MRERLDGRKLPVVQHTVLHATHGRASGGWRTFLAAQAMPPRRTATRCGHRTHPEQPELAGATRAGASRRSAAVARATGSTGTPDGEPPAVALLWRGFVATRTGSARTRTA